MKFKFFINTLILCFVILSPLLAQNYNFVKKGKDVIYEDNYGELGKERQFTLANISDYRPDDLIMDQNNNIFICDRFTKTICKYDSLLNPLLEIKINDEHFKAKTITYNKAQIPEELLYKAHLGLDRSGNLYVLLTTFEKFYKLLKYDRNGNILASFTLSRPYPMPRTLGIEVSPSDNIFITTFPYSPADIKYFDDGTVFVYDSNGKFLARTDYFIEDSKGNIYKQNTLNKRNKLWIDQFKTSHIMSVTKTSSLQAESYLSANLPNNTSFHFIGIDSKDKLYFVTNDFPFLIKIFDFTEKQVVELSLIKEQFEDRVYNQYNIYVPFNPFILSHNGEIFLYGLKSMTGEKNFARKINFQTVKLDILKLQINK